MGSSVVRERLWIVTAFVLSAMLLYSSQSAFTLPGVPAGEVSVTAARTLFDSRRLLVLDVREKDAYVKGHLPGAISVPLGELAQRIGTLGLTKADPVLVYCGEGSNRAPDATRELNARGYERAVNLKGGFASWLAAGQPVAH
jgi:rhodanese-related sulfurtransferase